LKQIAKIF